MRILQDVMTRFGRRFEGAEAKTLARAFDLTVRTFKLRGEAELTTLAEALIWAADEFGFSSETEIAVRAIQKWRR